MGEFSDFVERNMPRQLGYGFYLNDDETEMTVVAIHPDSASLEFHLDKGATAFRNMAEFIVLGTIEVYGRPSEKVLGQLRQKAVALGEGNGCVVIHECRAGFSPIPPE